MFKPWIGPKYATTRLLLLGESAYSWKTNGKIKHPPPEHCKEQVDRVVDDFRGCCSSSGFMPKLSRALTNKREPTREELRFAWDRVAFANYVPCTVGLGPRTRPTEEMWATASKRFPELLKEVQPKRIIVLGKTMWNNMPDSHIYVSTIVQGYHMASGEISMCWALAHPSRGLSWQELADVIHFAYQQELSI